MLWIPPEHKQGHPLAETPDSLLARETERHELRGVPQSNRFEPRLRFFAQLPDLNRMVSLLPLYENLIPGHRLEVAESYPDFFHLGMRDDVPTEGSDHLDLGDPPRWVFEVVARWRSRRRAVRSRAAGAPRLLAAGRRERRLRLLSLGHLADD